MWWKIEVRQDWTQENKIVSFDKEDSVDISGHPDVADIYSKIEIPVVPIGNITEECFTAGFNL